MTSPKLGLLPASGDDRFALLAALELASSGVLQFRQVVRAEVGRGCVKTHRSPKRNQRIESG